MVGPLDSFGAENAVIAGHEWGAPVAWHAALLRPDRFRGVIGLSVPFLPRRTLRPSTTMPQNEDSIFYRLYFQTPGVPELELERDVRISIRSFRYTSSGDMPARAGAGAVTGTVGIVPRKGGMLSRMVDPTSLPGWISEAGAPVQLPALYSREEESRTTSARATQASMAAERDAGRPHPTLTTWRPLVHLGAADRIT